MKHGLAMTGALVREIVLGRVSPSLCHSVLEVTDGCVGIPLPRLSPRGRAFAGCSSHSACSGPCAVEAMAGIVCVRLCVCEHAMCPIVCL